MLDAMLQLINGIPGTLAVFILAITPIIEIRGALPIALAVYKMPLLQAISIAILGNMIPAFLIIYGWDSFICWAKKYWPWLYRMMEKIEARTQGKWDEKIERYGPLALVLFVAIPLPFSGVWTGALAAWLFRLSRTRAIISIFLGVLLAGIGLTLITYGGLKFF